MHSGIILLCNMLHFVVLRVMQCVELYCIILYNTGGCPPSLRLCITNFASNIYSPISSEIIDGFWHSRSLNNHINLQYGANVSLVAKNGTKKIIPLLWIKSSKKPQIKKFHKNRPPNVGILIQNTISKFSKTKS